MQHVKSAIFKTYSGKKIPVDFLFPMPVLEKSVNYTKEKLADALAQKTAHSGDPIVQCISITTI